MGKGAAPSSPPGPVHVVDYIVNQLSIDIERCKGCGLCVEACPNELLEIADEPNASGCYPAGLANPAACTACGLCATVCPDAAIAVYKEIKAKAL